MTTKWLVSIALLVSACGLGLENRPPAFDVGSDRPKQTKNQIEESPGETAEEIGEYSYSFTVTETNADPNVEFPLMAGWPRDFQIGQIQPWTNLRGVSSYRFGVQIYKEVSIPLAHLSNQIFSFELFDSRGRGGFVTLDLGETLFESDDVSWQSFELDEGEISLLVTLKVTRKKRIIGRSEAIVQTLPALNQTMVILPADEFEYHLLSAPDRLLIAKRDLRNDDWSPFFGGVSQRYGRRRGYIEYDMPGYRFDPVSAKVRNEQIMVLGQVARSAFDQRSGFALVSLDEYGVASLGFGTRGSTIEFMDVGDRAKEFIVTERSILVIGESESTRGLFVCRYSLWGQMERWDGGSRGCIEVIPINVSDQYRLILAESDETRGHLTLYVRKLDHEGQIESKRIVIDEDTGFILGRFTEHLLF